MLEVSPKKIVGVLVVSLVCVLVFLVLGGADKSDTVCLPGQCSVGGADDSKNIYTLAGLSPIVDSVAKKIDTRSIRTGALDRNNPEYIHVRFQVGITSLAQYAIMHRDSDVLEVTIKAIEYAFDHQTEVGDFGLSVPSSLADIDFTEGDIVSGTAFFLASLGTTLDILQSSDWYYSQLDVVERVELLEPKYAKALEYLLGQEGVLSEYDYEAPNRLFFDANAYYGLGVALGSNTAKDVGMQFAQQAMELQHADGYYREGGGYDSSYQGVALLQGYYLLAKLQPDTSEYLLLRQSLLKGERWLSSRILSTGEVSSEGNSRVYSGGENFLGKEKTLSVGSVYSSLIIGNYLDEEGGFLEKTQRVYEYYR